MCLLIYYNVAWYYDALNVSIAAAFENDKVGPSGYNPYPVLATPPIVPQSIWKQVPDRLKDRDHDWTDHVIMLQYNIPPTTMVTNNVTQCVVEFEQQYYSPDDLTLFFREMGLPTDTPVIVVGTTPTTFNFCQWCSLCSPHSHLGPNYPDQPGGEANLDIQYIMGVAPGMSLLTKTAAAHSYACMIIRCHHYILVDLCQLDHRDRRYPAVGPCNVQHH